MSITGQRQFRPQWTLTPRMLRQIKAIERTAGFLEALKMQPGELTKLYKTARVTDALSSMQIEGSNLTLERAFELAREIVPISLSDHLVTNVEREFINYLYTFDYIDNLRGERTYQVSARDLRNLHSLIVAGVRGGDRYAGQFRRESVEVGDLVGGKKIVHHQPPPWHEVEDDIEDLMEWINASAVKLSRSQIEPGVPDPWVHPVIVAGVAQHRLVWIHPFVDGNGRTARMFTTLILLYRDYDFKYLFDLSSYYNTFRDQYYAALRSADATGDYTYWLEFFLGGFAYQMFTVRTNAHQAAQGLTEKVEKPDAEEV